MLFELEGILVDRHQLPVTRCASYGSLLAHGYSISSTANSATRVGNHDYQRGGRVPVGGTIEFYGGVRCLCRARLGLLSEGNHSTVQRWCFPVCNTPSVVFATVSPSSPSD